MKPDHRLSPTRRHFLASVLPPLLVSEPFLMTTGLATLVRGAHAQSSASSGQGFPSRPIRLIVPFPAGGPVDVVARAVAEVAQGALRQTILIDNRPGGAGALGTDLAARAPGDGYTLAMGSTSTHSLADLFGQKLGYDAATSFSPVALIGTSPAVLVVHPRHGQDGLTGFIKRLKAAPGKLSYASSGPGSFNHLLTEDFKRATGTFVVHVPYRGTGQAMNDLIGGQIDMMFDSVVTALPQARSGRIIALASTSAQRLSLAQELPTLAETVLPKFDAALYFGIFAPAATPADIVQTLNTAFNRALSDGTLKDRLARAGVFVQPGKPSDLGQMSRSEATRWKRLVAERGLRAD